MNTRQILFAFNKSKDIEDQGTENVDIHIALKARKGIMWCTYCERCCLFYSKSPCKKGRGWIISMGQSAIMSQYWACALSLWMLQHFINTHDESWWTVMTKLFFVRGKDFLLLVHKRWLGLNSAAQCDLVLFFKNYSNLQHFGYITIIKWWVYENILNKTEKEWGFFSVLFLLYAFLWFFHRKFGTTLD